MQTGTGIEPAQLRRAMQLPVVSLQDRRAAQGIATGAWRAPRWRLMTQRHAPFPGFGPGESVG
jgi:hypothetical protein